MILNFAYPFLPTILRNVITATNMISAHTTNIKVQAVPVISTTPFNNFYILYENFSFLRIITTQFIYCFLIFCLKIILLHLLL